MMLKYAGVNDIKFKVVESVKEMLFPQKNEVHYIGGSDILPPPLEAEEEAEALLRLENNDVAVKAL